MEDGKNLVALAGRRPPQAIVLDIMMPPIDGYAAALRRPGDPATRDAPVVILTASDRLAEVVRHVVDRRPGHPR